jgi:hypothetical protein
MSELTLGKPCVIARIRPLNKNHQVDAKWLESRPVEKRKPVLEVDSTGFQIESTEEPKPFDTFTVNKAFDVHNTNEEIWEYMKITMEWLFEKRFSLTLFT